MPVFRTDKLKEIAVNAINEARNSHKSLILVYVIMPDHYRIITDGKRKISELCVKTASPQSGLTVRSSQLC